ncbi:MAG: YciI family protein [Polyangiaceae bacterium]
MKFMMMHKHQENAEAAKKPSAYIIAEMGKLVGGMAQSGRLFDGAGLGPSATRSRLTFKRGERTVLHGPSAGSNELPAGYVMVKVTSREEAIEWATKIAGAIGGDLELEVGKVNEPWDLGIGEKPANAPLRYLILHKATPAFEAGTARDLSKVKDEMAKAGVLQTTGALTPSSRGKRLNFVREGNKQTVKDGPFSESKELIGGYVVAEFASMEECLALCHTYAQILLSESDHLEIDIRPTADN